MAIQYFVYGLVTGVVLTFVLLAASYLYLKNARADKQTIKGYLDLIADLSDRQRAQVQEIRRVFLPRVEEIRQNMRRKRAELAELLFAEPADHDRIHALSNQIIRRQSELEHEVIEHILEEKELLSAAQKRTFYQIITDQFSAGGLGVHDLKSGTKPLVKRGK